MITGVKKFIKISYFSKLVKESLFLTDIANWCFMSFINTFWAMTKAPPRSRGKFKHYDL